MSSESPNRPHSAISTLFQALIRLILGIMAGMMTIGLMLFGLYIYLQSQLPELYALNDVHYQSPLKVYTRDGLLISVFGEKVRYPMEFEDLPQKMIQAFLAAEDNRFYDHPGFDYQGLLRASLTFLSTGEKRQGGSTITMQVARNFFLSNEKTFLRKIREILLAMKIESELPKNRILEIYLNKIYLGNHAYGVGAAAEIYYNKTVDELDLAEIATIAGLPKAPSTFNPIINPERALTRRDYVLDRMLALGFITNEEYTLALAAPNTAALHERSADIDMPYIGEIIRNQMYEQYGEDAYNNGYQVRTTIDSQLQALAEDTLRSSQHRFDERRQFRPIRERIDLAQYATEADWDKQLAQFGKLGYTEPALILTLKNGAAEVYLGSGKRMNLSADFLSWAHRWLGRARRKKGEDSGKALSAGDVIRLRHDGTHLKLTQIPEVGAAMVSVLPQDGQVVALAGGYDFRYSKFNRAIQSKRQPGSGFKPVVYSTALIEGMTPSTVVNDSPVRIGNWTPMNASRRYYGPTPLRTALTYSRNVVAVKLAQKIGIDKVIKLAMDMGFEAGELPRVLPLALGSGSASPLRMAQMYSVFANGGFRVDPYFIARVDSDSGKIIYQATPPTACLECEDTRTQPVSMAKRVLSPRVHYMMNSMLQDVVRMGTGRRALALGRHDVAGKTGTTNKSHDAWFDGYTPALVTITWFGFDSYKSLGHNVMGGELALPMWVKFMREALKDVPEYRFPPPQGGRVKRVKTGPKGALDFEYYPDGKARQFIDSGQGVRSRSTKRNKAGSANPRPKSNLSTPPKSGSGKSIESLF